MLSAFMVRCLIITITAVFQILLDLWVRLGSEALFKFRKFLLEWFWFLSFIYAIFVFVQSAFIFRQTDWPGF